MKSANIADDPYWIDLRRLRELCVPSTRQVLEEASRYEGGKKRIDYQDIHVFIDRNSDVLSVAHADTVIPAPHKFKVKRKKDLWSVRSTSLDNRLGIYTILDYLPQLGIECDVLICDDEEIGQSTARDFKTDKQYNWIVEFDRSGIDVVFYDYADWRGENEWTEAVEKFFPQRGLGSFSDISDLEHLGCKAVNIGNGNYMNHTPEALFSLDLYKMQLAHFKEFYSIYKDRHFPHEPSSKPVKVYSSWELYRHGDTTRYLCPKCSRSFLESDTMSTVEAISCPECGLFQRKDKFTIYSHGKWNGKP